MTIEKIIDTKFDLNSLIVFGSLKARVYWVNDQVKNFPWSNGWLICLPSSTGSNCSNKQIILRHGTGNTNNYMMQVRNYYSGTAKWSDWYSYATNIDLQSTRMSSAYNVPADGKQELQVSVAKNGLIPIAIAGFYGLKDGLYPRQFWLEGETANIHLHNQYSFALSGTLQVLVLYKPS